MSTILSRHPLYVEKNIPSKYYLESEQHELSSEIRQATEKLKMLAIASPSEIVPKDEDPVCSLSTTVDDWVDLIIKAKNREGLTHYEVDKWGDLYEVNPTE